MLQYKLISVIGIKIRQSITLPQGRFGNVSQSVSSLNLILKDAQFKEEEKGHFRRQGVNTELFIFAYRNTYFCIAY